MEVRASFPVDLQLIRNHGGRAPYIVAEPVDFIPWGEQRGCGLPVVSVCLPQVHVLKCNPPCEVLRGGKFNLMLVLRGGTFGS